MVLSQIASMAQVKIVALHRQGSSVQYFSNENDQHPFQLAYNAAVDGDTIYLTGGTFTPPNPFNKRLIVFGAGHFPSATGATLSTKISGNLNFGGLADGSHFEGIEMLGSIIYPAESVNDVTVKRCRIAANITASSTSGDFSLSNYFLENVILGQINLLNVRSVVFANNIIGGTSRNLITGMFMHNIFLRKTEHFSETDWLIFYADATTFSNNIFINSVNYWGGQNILNNGTCVWNNNVFRLANPTLGTDPFLSNNHFNQTITNLLVNYTSESAFSYSQDYRLTALGLGLAASDGTQVGIYGGTGPFKEESVPVIPHIQSAIIQPSSNNGQLNVNIQVKAQVR